MSNRMPPSFPQPFAPAGTSYPARDVAGTPEQRFIDPVQATTYPPDSMFARNTLGTSFDTPYRSQPPFPVQSHGSTPHLMPILNAPPQHPSPHLAPYIPPYQLVQGPTALHRHSQCLRYKTRVCQGPLSPHTRRHPQCRLYTRLNIFTITKLHLGIIRVTPTRANYVAFSITAWIGGVGGWRILLPLSREIRTTRTTKNIRSTRSPRQRTTGTCAAKSPPSYVASWGNEHDTHDVMSQMRATLS
ncbi:hypothetical protein EDB84DRAFT_1079540 [Lactarius hengduanensis]|nr:hypothetical protein EDB84DRAFT_1079540 [Lactarius hengduanensis]